MGAPNPRVTQAVLQRFPMISHAFVLLFAVFGPSLAPVAFALYSVLIQFIILGVNCRTVYGTFAAWRGVRKHAATDWEAVYNAAAAKATNVDGAPVLAFRDVEHIIVIPNYCEDITVLRETLYLLSTHPLAKWYHPVLAMEAREMGARTKAEALLREFGGAFASLSYTLHPGGIEGEAAGKSSNLSWAARQAWFTLTEREPEAVARTVITVLDADTALAGDYFASISCKFALRTPEERTRMSFVPPIVFDRNAKDVPVAVRLVDLLWALGGMSTIYPSSSAKIPTSAYSVSLILALRVGFWDAGPDAIGEDMHMFIKTQFCTSFNLISETIYSPASQLDVCGEPHNGSVVSRFFSLSDHVARYKQAVRHLWGSLDTGYFLHRILHGEYAPCERDFDSVARHGAPIGAIRVHHLDEHLNAVSSSTPPAWVDTVGSRTPRTPFSESSVSSPLETISEATSVSSLDLELDTEDGHLLPSRHTSEPHKVALLPLLTLGMRLFEAHLLIAHVTILALVRGGRCLLGGVCSTQVIPLTPTTGLGPRSTRVVQWSNAFLDPRFGAVFIGLTVAMVALYGLYHQEAARHRWSRGDGLGAQPGMRSYRRFPWSSFDLLAFPGVFVFGILPTLHAQTMHLFTNRLVYTVSFKPAAAAVGGIGMTSLAPRSPDDQRPLNHFKV